MKKMQKVAALCVAMVMAIAFVGCSDDDKDSVGCATLKAGSKCSETSACSQRFLCLTGQGSDKDCTSGCSCQ